MYCTAPLFFFFYSVFFYIHSMLCFSAAFSALRSNALWLKKRSQTFRLKASHAVTRHKQLFYQCRRKEFTDYDFQNCSRNRYRCKDLCMGSSLHLRTIRQEISIEQPFGVCKDRCVWRCLIHTQVTWQQEVDRRLLSDWQLWRVQWACLLLTVDVMTHRWPSGQ